VADRICKTSSSESPDCWIDIALSGKPIEEIHLRKEMIDNCLKCDDFHKAINRSAGRRSSDRLIQEAVGKLISMLAKYNSELSSSAENLSRRIAELTVLETVAEFLLKALNLKDCLKVFLTAVTAGEAFGFNRAVVFLVNQPRRALEGQLGFGHVDLGKYRTTWGFIHESRLTFSDMMQRILDKPELPDNDLTEIVKNIYVPMTSEFGLLPEALIKRKSFKVEHATAEHITDRNLLAIFGGRACAIVPIICKESALGVLIVDNPITSGSITDDEIAMLETLSYLAASKIDNLILHNQLELRIAELEHVHALLHNNQEYLIQTERLVEAGRLATTIAHELKTPLATIGGYGRRALRSHGRGDDITQDLNVIVSEITRLEGITVGILDYSKKRKLNLTVLDLNELISETLEILADKLSFANIEVHIELTSATSTVKADRDRLKQVVFNLIENATQAMPDGGTLTVSTGTNGGWEWFRVTDTGCGMSQETIDNLFKPFFTTRSSGAGLGLPVSKRIVADHGGFVEVSSTLGEGSSFTVNLPTNRHVKEV